jgi:hypothetical protein
MLRKRRHIKHTASFDERLADLATRLKEQALKMPLGKDRDALLKRARRAETAVHINEWLNSPGLRPPIR